MKNSYIKFVLFRFLLPLLFILQVSACASADSDSLVPEGQIAVPVSAVTHYGKGIGVSEFYVNGRMSGHEYDGWGSSGDSCCMSMSDTQPQPLMVTVKWKTYRTTFKEERWHEATVPVHFVVPPGKSYGMVVHFLPGHRVEVWFADQGVGSPTYPGPAYPRGPAPDYVPLADEAATPKQGK